MDHMKNPAVAKALEIAIRKTRLLDGTYSFDHKKTPVVKPPKTG